MEMCVTAQFFLKKISGKNGKEWPLLPPPPPFMAKNALGQLEFSIL